MENTATNKVKFMSQYFGQKVFVNPMLSKEPVLNIYLFDYDPELQEDIDDEYLELRPLSSITDEEVAMAVKIGCYSEALNVVFHENEDGLLWTLDFANPKFGKNSVVSQVSLFVIDYLRSKGYALPFMGLSVEYQINYGWVKLTEKC